MLTVCYLPNEIRIFYRDIIKVLFSCSSYSDSTAINMGIGFIRIDINEDNTFTEFYNYADPGMDINCKTIHPVSETRLYVIVMSSSTG